MEILTMEKIKAAAILVGQVLEKGRSECVYQKALSVELNRMGLETLSEEIIPIQYKDVVVGFERSDLVLPQVEMILELKVVPKITTDHHWQLIHYLKAKKFKVGIVINFSNKEDTPVTLHAVLLQPDGIHARNLTTGEEVPVKSISF